MHSRSLLLVAALTVALGLAACGSDGGEASGATTTVTVARTTAAPTTTVAKATTSAPTTAAPTTAAPTTAAPTTTVVAGPVVVEVDGDATTPAEQTVPLGSQVELRVTSATAQEFHLHGFDLEQTGTNVVFAFTADQAGEFELESHATEQVVLLLTVA